MVEVSPQYVFLSFVISLVTVVAVIFSAHRMVRHAQPGIRLLDIIRDDDWYPSLALFQFLTWTCIIAFLYLGIYLIRAFGGVVAIMPSMPSNLLVLMGISVAVPVISGRISNVQYGAYSPKPRPENPPPFSTMLEEGNKPTLTRFQMFVWTWVAVVIYLGLFIAMLAKPGSLQAVENLCMPDIDPTLVVLMGLSQGAYIGGKLVAYQAMKSAPKP